MRHDEESPEWKEGAAIGAAGIGGSDELGVPLFEAASLGFREGVK